MKFSVESHNDGEFVLRAEPGEYDATPLLNRVTVEAVPWTRHPDRLAAALFLIYAGSCSGSFELPAPGCSPHVAVAIEDFFSPSLCKVFPINLVPSRIVGGDIELYLSLGTHRSPVAMHADGEGVEMRLLGEGTGALMSGSEFSVVTNALLIGADENDSMRRLLPAVGVALLFCEDLFVGRINLPRADVQGHGVAEVEQKLRRLLDSVGLRLRWT